MNKQPRTVKILSKLKALEMRNNDTVFLTRKTAEKFFTKMKNNKVHFNDTVMRTVRYLYQTNRLDRVSRGKYKITSYGRVSVV